MSEASSCSKIIVILHSTPNEVTCSSRNRIILESLTFRCYSISRSASKTEREKSVTERAERSAADVPSE